jgi:hypothetical protein
VIPRKVSVGSSGGYGYVIWEGLSGSLGENLGELGYNRGGILKVEKVGWDLARKRSNLHRITAIDTTVHTAIS